ncbi:MAG TPA: GNAT family N-acetyltransferase [Gammaproteobacteria bacterium]|jgi:GNAT superfamily N-acetyltransferase|nr:GNAT family N-acetyltransferase [Gammaproteobacteria bacterium]
MQLSFRQAEPADVAAIHGLVESAYRGEASRAGWTTEADFLDGQRIDCEGIRDAIGKPDSYVLLAERDDVTVACAHIERRGDACYFGMFAVRPEMQGAGLGKALLTEAERRAQALWQSQTMRMTVIDLREDLIAWYLRRGYRRTGEHAPFPYGQERFGIPRRDDLRFEWLVKEIS